MPDILMCTIKGFVLLIVALLVSLIPFGMVVGMVWGFCTEGRKFFGYSFALLIVLILSWYIGFCMCHPH